MFGIGMGIGDNAERKRRDIREKADRIHGGPTTPWKVAQQIKRLSQRFDVGEYITIEVANGNLKVILGRKVYPKLERENKYTDFISRLVDEVEDCGYNIAVSDDFLEIHRV